MLNNGWPSLIWHLYDYYLVPAGGYYGTKKACEPVHVQYSYDDNSVAVVNGTYETLKGTKVSAKIYNIDAKEKASREATLDLSEDSSTKAFDLPKPDGLTPTYFLKLELHDAAGKLLSDNFYWLSQKADVLDWNKRKDTVYTPQKEFGDLTGLNSLPTAKLAITRALQFTGDIPPSFIVIAENKSDSVAFMVHPRLTRGKGGEDLTPVFWSDNYFSLLPGEKKSVTARFDSTLLQGATPELVVEGWNVEPTAH
jgi:exo-1,4-beta-D-glucosaminidase